MPGVSKGGGSRAGAAGVQHPVGLLLLILFLQEQEKNEENDDKINDHLSDCLSYRKNPERNVPGFVSFSN